MLDINATLVKAGLTSARSKIYLSWKDSPVGAEEGSYLIPTYRDQLNEPLTDDVAAPQVRSQFCVVFVVSGTNSLMKLFCALHSLTGDGGETVRDAFAIIGEIVDCSKSLFFFVKYTQYGQTSYAVCGFGVLTVQLLLPIGVTFIVWLTKR